MQSFSALDAKNRFGQLLDAARREPVSIEKHGRPVAVLLSREDYDALQAAKYAQLKSAIAEAEADLASGRLVEPDDAFAAALKGKPDA